MLIKISSKQSSASSGGTKERKLEFLTSAAGALDVQVEATASKNNDFSFLKPFAWQLWAAVVAMVFIVALVVQLLSRLSPLGRFEVCS